MGASSDGEGRTLRPFAEEWTWRPVLVDCREHALAVRETHGVWGAMSARDRRRVYSEAQAG